MTRYKYQGQEKDTETSKEAFELRLWDSRIGRWLTTDPAGQYSSPYLGMGNNPMNGIDPDGGSWLDIIFKDRSGNTIATYHDGKDKITEVVLPIEDIGSSPDINLNNYTKGLDVDIIGVGVNASITDIVGVGAGIEFIYFLDGMQEGSTYAYNYLTANAGAGGGIAPYGIVGGFMGDDTRLFSEDYIGTFNSLSVSGSVGVSSFWVDREGDVELYPGMARLWRDHYHPLWEGNTLSPISAKFSVQYSWAEYTLNKPFN